MRSLRRLFMLATAAVPAALLALPALPAFAQSNSGGSDFPDLVPVALWTVVVVIITLGVVSVGYLYRRENGMARPLHPPPPDPFGVMERHDLSRDAAGEPLPEHVLEHTAVLHDDASEQAKLLTERGH